MMGIHVEPYSLERCYNSNYLCLRINLCNDVINGHSARELEKDSLKINVGKQILIVHGLYTDICRLCLSQVR